MSRGHFHPFTGALYEQHGTNQVKVTAKNGTWGIFDLDGRWLEGNLKEADGQVCHWVGGPIYANHRLANKPTE